MVGQKLDDTTFSWIMKILSITSGAAIILLGILNFIFWSRYMSTPIDFMLAVYFILFGLAGIICEFPVPKVTYYFSFLKKYYGKGAYFIFIATISMDVSIWWGIIIFILVAATGLVYLVLSFALRNKFIEEEESEASAEKPKQDADNKA